MSFSSEWENLYCEGRHLSVWPWTDLVSLFMRYQRPFETAGGINVLEFGIGAGANIPFVLSVGGRIAGIDGSQRAITMLQERFGDNHDVRLHKGDFTKEIPFSDHFDAIIDRASITHNSEEGVRAALNNAFSALRPGGRLFSITLFSTDLAEFKTGNNGPDFWSKCGFTKGNLADTGIVHFFDELHIKDMYSQFEIEHIERRKISCLIPEQVGDFSYWNVVARRPA